jgi:hypothetical protein
MVPSGVIKSGGTMRALSTYPWPLCKRLHKVLPSAVFKSKFSVKILASALDQVKFQGLVKRSKFSLPNRKILYYDNLQNISVETPLERCSFAVYSSLVFFLFCRATNPFRYTSSKVALKSPGLAKTREKKETQFLSSEP